MVRTGEHHALHARFVDRFIQVGRAEDVRLQDLLKRRIDGYAAEVQHGIHAFQQRQLYIADAAHLEVAHQIEDGIVDRFSQRRIAQR